MARLLECAFPEIARNSGQIDPRSFRIKSGGDLCVLRYKELDGDLELLRLSISKAVDGVPAIVTARDIRAVRKALADRGMRWPAKYEKIRFSAGAFANLGIRIRETP